MLALKPCRAWRAWAIVHETKLPFSPYQNGKQEFFWARSKAAPAHAGDRDRSLLRQSTKRLWLGEMEYNHKTHSELGMSPLHCYLQHKDVGRPCPTSEQLQLAFTKEIPAPSVGRWHHHSGGIRLKSPSLRPFPGSVCAWPLDLSRVHLSDPQVAHLCRLIRWIRTKMPRPARRQSHAAARGYPAGYPAACAIAPETHQRLRLTAASGYLPKTNLP